MSVKGVRRVLDALPGARLVYGEPVRNGARTVIPVARVRWAGGGGWGSEGGKAGGDGGGVGGHVDARPLGFIEVGPDGARYEPIPDPERLTRALRAGATLLALGVARHRRRVARSGRSPARRPAGLLGRGR